MPSGLEAKVQMRSLLVALAGLMLVISGAAQAKVAITVDKDAQMMTVDVDGVPRYHWPVSTGIPSRQTPSSETTARATLAPLASGISNLSSE